MKGQLFDIRFFIKSHINRNKQKTNTSGRLYHMTSFMYFLLGVPSGLNPNGIEPNGIEPTELNPHGIEPNGIEPNGIEPTRD